MPQDLALDLLELRRRLEPELLGELRAKRLVARERLGLPARAVEGEQLPRAEAFSQRMPCDERIELADQVGVTPAIEVGVDPRLDAGEVELGEPGRLDPSERLLELR